jgi:hypothetical protein
MTIHKSITVTRLMRAARAQMEDLENPGFCVECGKRADGCEPDARGYTCEHCGKSAVYGAEELLFMVGG